MANSINLSSGHHVREVKIILWPKNVKEDANFPTRSAKRNFGISAFEERPASRAFTIGVNSETTISKCLDAHSDTSSLDVCRGRALGRAAECAVLFSDDWGRYASLYRDPAKPGMNDVIDTPALDAIGRSGVVFNNAFVSAPSCTPSRAAVVTGMPFYRCGSNAFLRCREYGNASDPYKSLPGFSELLVKNGYHVMHWGKTTNKAGKKRDLTHKDPICGFSQAVSAASDKEARKKEIFSFVRSNFRAFLDEERRRQAVFLLVRPA